MKMAIQFIDDAKKSMEKNANLKSKVYGSIIDGLSHTIPTFSNDTKLISMSNSVPASARSNTYSSMFSRAVIVLRQCCKRTAKATRFQGRSMRSQIILIHDMYLPPMEYGAFFNSRCIIENLPSSDFKFIFQISKLSLLATIPTCSPFYTMIGFRRPLRQNSLQQINKPKQKRQQ